MADAILKIEDRGNTRVLTMDDGKANALSSAMIEALMTALDAAEKEAGAIVLAGRPDRFCAGFDLKTMMSGFDAAKALVVKGGDLLLRLYTLERPVVVACTGHAMAGGALVLLTGDTRIGADGPYRIGLNEVSISMPLPVLAQELARDRLDPRQLTAATVQAKIYDPRGAADVGYLDAVTDKELLLEAATAEAQRLADLPVRAYASTKKSLRDATVRLIRDTMEADMIRLTPPG